MYFISFPIAFVIGNDVTFFIGIVLGFGFGIAIDAFVLVFLNLCNLRDLRKKFLSSSYLFFSSPCLSASA